MKLIQPPVKPFANYKWQWAVLTPTESLNDPPVFLGVLRVFYRYQNFAPSSKPVMDGLGVVQQETGTNVNLVRSQERNLVRNSGQYWKALGLLDEAQGKIHVSPFGQLLAEGKITQVEFATTVIKTLELPNKRIQSKTQDWDNIQLKIKPLELILDILADLSKRFGPQHEYITPFELRKIVVPLAGVKAILSDFADAIVQHRNNQINLSAWPDCAPESNDKRMVRSFCFSLPTMVF